MVCFGKAKLEQCLTTGYLSDHTLKCGGYRFKVHKLIIEEKAPILANLGFDDEIVSFCYIHSSANI